MEEMILMSGSITDRRMSPTMVDKESTMTASIIVATPCNTSFTSSLYSKALNLSSGHTSPSAGNIFLSLPVFYLTLLGLATS